MSSPSAAGRLAELVRGTGRRPLIVAPMAGGVSTPAMVVAAAEAGAIGFLAAGYISAAQLDETLQSVRAQTSQPFGVNLFVPGAPSIGSSVAAYAEELAPEATRLGADLGAPVWDDDDWAGKVEVVLDAAPALCSFTFGCPEPSLVEALQAKGTAVMVTVTSGADADTAVAAGVDGLCAQGIEAGAHRGTFDDTADDDLLPTLDLLAAIVDATTVPVVAAGGIARPDDVTAALRAGAVAVQVGTAFLRADESGASPRHQAALVDPTFADTAFTRAFTGRRARALVNRFTREHDGAPSAYPEIHHLTQPLRAAAAAQGDTQTAGFWAGVGHRHARAESTAAIIDWLCGVADADADLNLDT